MRYVLVTFNAVNNYVYRIYLFFLLTYNMNNRDLHDILEYLKIENLKKLSRDWSLLQKVRKQGMIFWHNIFLIPTFGLLQWVNMI